MLVAYHAESSEKNAILEQLRAHAAADEIIKGQYWEGGKGCAVGCTIHGSDHSKYETRFGIPQMLAKLEDCIFEGLPNERAKTWPIEFMSAIAPGADLSRVGWQFLHWTLTDNQVNPGIDNPLVRDAIKQCADVLVPLTKGETLDESAARSAAESAARSAAESAARSAAWSAESAARSAESAAWSAESAARSAAWSARSAAESAARSAESAARSAWSPGRSAESAARSAESAAYVRMADKLLELLKAAPHALAA
jgi:hypothetical protein